jgi:hypothetical protein
MFETVHLHLDGLNQLHMLLAVGRVLLQNV